MRADINSQLRRKKRNRCQTEQEDYSIHFHVRDTPAMVILISNICEQYALDSNPCKCCHLVTKSFLF